MITLISLLMTTIGKCSWLNKKRDTNLAGAKAALGTDLKIAKTTLQVNFQIGQLKAMQNNWIGAKIIAGTAGELSAIHYGSIIHSTQFFIWAGTSQNYPLRGIAIRGSF